MKTQFSETLSEIIAQSGISKNELIRICDIDRSSFFKFLNGTRTPTRKQLDIICKKLLLTPDEELALRRAYISATKGDKQITISRRVLDILWLLERGETKKGETFAEKARTTSDMSTDVICGRDSILSFLTSAVMDEIARKEGEREIYTFLPDEEESFREWLAVFMHKHPDHGLKVCDLIAISSRLYNTEEVAAQLKYPLLCSLRHPDSYSGYYFYTGSAGIPDAGALYMYSILLGGRTILLNRQMDRAIVVADQKCCREDRKSFLSALNHAYPLLRKSANKEISRTLSEGIVYCYGGCSLDRQLWSDKTIKFFSMTDLGHYLNSAFSGPDDRSAKILTNRKKLLIRDIREHIGSRTFIVDERFLPPAERWCAALTFKEELMIYSEAGRCFFLTDEIHIVRAFQSFFEELAAGGVYLNNDVLASEVLDGISIRIL